MKNCLNCGTQILEDQRYCPNCGQKTAFKALSLWMVFKDFIKNVFNLESKIWSSLRDIWIPGKLTQAYLKGVRNKYFNPIRFFLVTIFAFFALVVFISSSFINTINGYLENQKKLAWQIQLEEKFDTISLQNTVDSTLIKKYKDQLFENNWAKIKEDREGSVQFAFGQSDIVPFYSMSKKELINHLKPESKFQEVLLLAVQRFVKSPREGLTFMIGNGAWAIVLLVVLFSVLYKVLYIRKNYLFVEHFILHLYGHTRMLLLGVIFLPVAYYLFSHISLFIIFLITGFLYLLLTIKKVYNQNWFITVVKTGLSGIFYFFCALASIQGMVFLSLFMF